MKTITTIGSVRKADSSLDPTLNPVELPSKEIVSWGVSLSQARTRASNAASSSGPAVSAVKT
jgi:hypothetical protein